ncbi:MAG: hypothetical protein ACOY82_05920 [Pseudomonadota bacterium]
MIDVDSFWQLCDDAYCCFRFQQAIETHESLEEIGKSRDAHAILRINSVFIDWTLLQISRLHDSENFSKKGIVRKNLCISFFRNPKNWPLNTQSDSGFFGKIVALCDSLDSRASHLTSARNWLLAHNDREAWRIGDSLGECPEHTYEAYFKDLQSFVDLLIGAFSPGEFRPFVQTSGNDMAGLLTRLMKANRNP